MITISSKCNSIFNEATAFYHTIDNVDARVENPYQQRSLEHYLYLKNWIDDVQWHLEDIIRDPEIDPSYALSIKRRIDDYNQKRTDLVETIDSYFYNIYKDVKVSNIAKINTESPAWAIDRLSILTLKIWHMNAEVQRTDADINHIYKCREKLDILYTQKEDLSSAIDFLLYEIENGNKYIKVYKQMKMYNDPALNPILYNKECADR